MSTEGFVLLSQVRSFIMVIIFVHHTKLILNNPVAFFSTAGSVLTSSQVVFGLSVSPQLYFQHKVLLQLNTR